MKSKTDIAYAAGIIDGEGCIAVSRNKGLSFVWPYIFRLHIQITSTDSILTDWFQANFGGYVYKRKPRKKNNYFTYQWCVVSNQADDFLQTVLPYLRLKKEQAKLAIEFQSKKRLRREHRKGCPRQRSPIIYKYENNVYKKLRQLKRIKLCTPK